MEAEQLIFAIIAFALFIYMFYKMIKDNETSYVILIIMQAFGIVLNFIEIISKVQLNLVLSIIKYLLAVLLPIVIIILEKNKIPYIEIVDISKALLYKRMGDNRKAKQALIHLVTKYPENYKGHKMLAEIYEDEGGMR